MSIPLALICFIDGWLLLVCALLCESVVFLHLFSELLQAHLSARTDEIGVPFAVTVDSTDSVTIGERDSKEQIRVSIDEAASTTVKELADGQSTWSDIMRRHSDHVAAFSHAAAQSNEEWNGALYKGTLIPTLGDQGSILIVNRIGIDSLKIELESIILKSESKWQTILNLTCITLAFIPTQGLRFGVWGLRFESPIHLVNSDPDDGFGSTGSLDAVPYFVCWKRV